jgi:hypothetical protein
MTKKPIDYSKALFYRLVCRDVSIKECYVGSTTNETQRRANHKSRCTNENDPKHNLYVYRFIRDHGSWDNWQLIVIEHRPVNSKRESLIRERFFVEQYMAKLNKQVPSRTQAEYHVDHKETQNKKSAAYKLTHADHLKTHHTCACGGCYITSHMSNHLKTKKHTAYEAAK